MLLPLALWAQEPEVLIRYVKTDGAYANDGKSWGTAKNNIQDAINDLYDLIKNTDKEGHVYVAAGTYRPTESTESDKDGMAYTAFKIYEGITVYGGFPADGSVNSPEGRPYSDKNSTPTPYYYGKKFTNVTILDGNHTNMGDKKNLNWDKTKQQYATTFPGNSYHVVWFATKGFDTNGRAKGLSKPARLDGCTVQGGYASNRVSSSRHHNSYGGGIYMVDGSYVDNCIVTQNAATRAGGAIYLDGGGEVNHSYVRYNQTLGVGINDGFGGGICVDGTGVVRHTVMAENMARMGGGLALLSEIETTGNRYAPVAAGCVVGNNTSNTEAGGVYMRYGGVLNHMAIVNNQCNGVNLVYGKRRYGRSAGIYIDKYGEVFNTVCWGGKIEANSDIQYAAYADASQTEQPRVHYSAFAHNEITDWSSTIRMDVYSLSTQNEDYVNDGNYPEFINPTIRTSADAITYFTGVGVAEKATELGVANFAPLWQPYRNSYLRGKGIMLKEYDYALDRWETLKQASIEEDFQGTKFSPKTALGAFVTRSEDITPAEITVNGKTYLTLYVDPSHTSSKSISRANQDLEVGNSWDNPVGNLNDALLYFSMKEGKDGGATAEKKGRILVKEGETNTRGNYMTDRLRSSSFNMVSNVEVYGGYPKELTGTFETDRNPVKHPTHVTGDIADDKYANNVHHLVRFGDVHNAVFDGFRLYAGNAASTAISTASSRHGGGVLVYTTANGKTCTDNVLRNCLIANCSALQGAGIYVTGLGQDLANDPHRTISLTVENCIIHNNTSTDATTPSAVCARGGKTTLTLNHCTVRGNVGYGVAATENAKVTMNNSVVHANAREAMGEIADLTTQSGKVLTLYTNGTGSITGDYNFIDNGTDITKLGGLGNQAILTYTDNATNYPKFVNPTRNVGHSEKVDNTIYGGYPNFMPTNISPLVNAANSNGTNYNSATDITANHTRNYGGLPDVGAVENTALLAYGTVYYVRKVDGNDNDDGLSWTNAFATVSKALEMAEASNGVCKQIWVAAGEYEPTSLKTVNGQKSAYVMLEGVDVFGGFPQTGCPGMEERNPKQYISYLQVTGTKTEKDGSTINKRTSTSIGRVLVQAENFTTETTWNGFAIRNGYLHACYRQNINGNLNSIDKANVGLAGGAGVYLQANGIIENCTIEDNLIYVFPGGPNLSQSNSNAGGGYHQAGAGVYNSGGTIKNCVIRNNVLEHRLYSNGVVQSAWIYGAGLFMEDGNVFNTIITGNECKINDNGGLVGYHEVIVGAGAFLFKGNFYNNTIVSNQANTTNCNNVHISVPGLYVFDYITMYNCVVSGNTSTGGPDDKSKVGYPVASFSYSGSYIEDPSHIKAHYCVVNISEADSKNLIKRNPENTNNIFSDPLLDISYLPQNSSPCINMGTEKIEGVTIPDVDAGYSERVQDCTIDIGAYEYNGAKNITPTIETTDGVTTAYYYITQNGRGTATAESPANAACWEKLQKVLDAAGRYKYNNPEKQVVVKLAAFPAGGDAGYMPRRSSVTEANNPDAENPRSFSIMVPRGVEVWGGYTDAYTSEDDHGFLKTNRNITTNKTTLSGLYQAEGQDVNVYHVVTFTDYTFDTEGKVTENFLSNEGKISAMGDHDKAILDGLFITGGLADGVKAENQRGGAAVLPDYAHVRNCIVHTNEASEEGGALYMKPSSLVSGTLLINNRSGNRGGAIYVEEPLQAQAEDVPAEQGDAKEYARVFTSTIVKNSALQGGGINFQTNLRANSVVLWDNDANMQANIAGQLDPFSTQVGETQTMEDFPLSFSAVENQLVAGINNLQLHSEEDKGARFVKDGLYGLTSTSILVRSGMRYEEYETLIEGIPSILRLDFAGINRVGYKNDYIDIGARAFNQRIHPEAGEDNLLTRLYVVSSELEIDLDLQRKLIESDDPKYKQQGSSFANPMIRLDDALDYVRKARKSNIADVNNKKFEIFISRGTFYPLRTIRGEYSYSRANTYLVPEGVSIIGGMDTQINYGQETSGTTEVGEKEETKTTTSETYRAAWLESLGDKKNDNEARKSSTPQAEGYWATNPMVKKTLNSGNIGLRTDECAKPTKTSIEWNGTSEFTVYFTYNKNNGTINNGRYTINNVDGDYVDIDFTEGGYGVNRYWRITCSVWKYTYYYHRENVHSPGIATVIGATTIAMRDARLHYDLNNNGIIEPWEMKEQTILSGANVNSVNSENVYHVIAAIPAEQWVGKLPGTSNIAEKTKEELENLTKEKADAAKGTKHVEQGEPIMLDGLYISDGHAYGYEPNFVGSKHTYYKGGAICVNGNWVTGSTADAKGDKDMYLNTDVYNPLGYRNIPLSVVNCQFSNNMGGMGGAIFSNGDLEIYGCSFTQNYSKGGEDTEKVDEETTQVARYTGNGGAINASGTVTIANTLFANNEAQKGNYTPLQDDIQDTGGWGGAILAGEHSRLHILNCNFVRNKATNYPAIYNYVANKGWKVGNADYSPDIADNKNDYTSNEVRINNPHRVVNSIFWGNEAEGIHKAINFGTEREEVEHLWFCAYGKDCGLTPVVETPTADFDYRKVEFHFHDDDDDGYKETAAYIPALFQHYYTEKVNGGTVPTDPAPWRVTNNLILNTENTALDGPNFINPSQKAGIEGYMASADWMLSRINNLVDNGWTYLEQNEDGKYDDPASIQDLTGSGVYKTVADESEGRHGNFTLMPYGNQEYMYYPDLLDDGVRHRQMLRISNDPNLTRQNTFIDLGLYEYQHLKLNPTTEQNIRDVLWVTENERQDLEAPADGSTWERATSDLQSAIEVLLAGRNGHAKEIRMIEGTYMPVYTISENLGFKISTSAANDAAVTTDGSEAQGIASLTIRGGYSSEVADVYDYHKYPVHIVSAEREGVPAEHIKHLFFIENALQYTSVKTNNQGMGGISNTPTDKVVPITFNGITFTNSKAVAHDHHHDHAYQGGAAIYYADQLKNATDYANAPDGAKRLTISNCIFLQNGFSQTTNAATTGAVPAVSIGQGGGDALIYNSLFHSNTGDPLLAWDTKVINSTFALNGGTVKLNNQVNGYASGLHNSILWKNNQNNTAGITEISGLAGITYKNNAISGITKDETNKNEGLADDNDDIFTGPNFFDPENRDATLRDFRIKPSAVLLSGASDETFATMVLAKGALTDAQYKEAVAGTTDLAYFQPRSYGKGLDRGAYECHEKLNRIIYVDPNKVTRTGTGDSWEHAYEYSRLQNAIDATSVYLMTEASTEKSAYVFVKGKREGSTDEAITLRNGVQVYGSIDPGYTKMVDDANMNTTIETDEIEAYVTQLRTDRPGLAGTHTYRTTVKGVATTATAHNQTTLLDGFVVSNPTPTATPAVDLKGDGTQNHLAIRNSIIAGNTVTGDGQPVVNVKNGLLYNVLVQENSVQGSNVVSISAMGRMVNGTVVTDENNKTPVLGDLTNHVLNSISYNSTEATAISPFAPYFQPGAGAIGYHTDKPAYLTDNHYLWYQLHDGSKKIDEGNTETGVKGKLPDALDGFINYDTDRDILGNKRLFNEKVDMGCFETWNIKTDQELDYVPAEGSVVYIQKEKELRLNSGLKQTFSPGYLLLSEGASLYGQGARVELNYVAVEKAMPQGNNLLSLPYSYNLAHTVKAVVNTGTDQLTETTVTPTVYSYDGAARAAHGYHFVTEDSECWDVWDNSTSLPANKGVLFTGVDAGTYRITAFAPTASDRLYTEGGAETHKAVTLTQYNLTPTNGSAAFTSAENMGWNLVGMPYLVNSYATHILADGTYQMHIPHVFHTLKDDGNYETTQSWEAGSTLSLGNAFFTQTATLDATEQLQFKLPVYVQAQAIDTRALLSITSEEGSDAVQLNPDESVEAMTDYQLNYDGAKLQAINSTLPQLYALGNRGSRLSLVGSAPVEQEINLGFYAAQANEPYTFNLPHREAFANYSGVWLKDNQTGIVTNLLTEDYTLTADNAGTYDNRLTLQIGGVAPSLSGWNYNARVIHVRDGKLRLNHLETGNHIRIFTVDGRLIQQTSAMGSTYVTNLPAGTYIVKVSAAAYKN